MFSKINRIIFIGGNRYSEDGPLIEFIDLSLKLGMDVVVVTDEERSLYPTQTMGLFHEALEDKKIQLLITREISLEFFSKYQDENTLIFCVNCKWILSSELISMFPGRIFNYHNSALPEQRGASCHSWRLMQKINFSRLTIHQITSNIDQGDIYLDECIEFNESNSNLHKSYLAFSSKELEVFSKFLNGDFEVKKQDMNSSFYWPKLSTEINGFINWNWSAKDIVSFCSAFDKPFVGASTYLDGLKVNFLDVELVDQDCHFHPFQAGLIYRIIESKIYIATIEGGICVNDLKISNKISLREGLRFVTPTEKLFSALVNKVF